MSAMFGISISTSSAARWATSFYEGMTFTLTLTALAALGGLIVRHG